jgi:DNA-binding MarR family transcriptional regulator
VQVNIASLKTFVSLQSMFGGSSPAALASRFTAIAQNYIADGPAERAERARRKLLSAIGDREPATLKQVAAAVRRGEPAVSRSIDTLVRAGLVDRAADPTNRRRLAMRLSEAGRRELEQKPRTGTAFEAKLGRLAQSELRAIERAVEILER